MPNQRVRRESEIDQDLSCLGDAPRLDMHRQAELTDQRLSRLPVGANAPVEVFDVDIGDLAARRVSKLVAVEDTATRSISGTEPEIVSARTGLALPISVDTMALNMATPPPHKRSRRPTESHGSIDMTSKWLFILVEPKYKPGTLLPPTASVPSSLGSPNFAVLLSRVELRQSLAGLSPFYSSLGEPDLGRAAGLSARLALTRATFGRPLC
jgi:hypothetical protein